MIRNLISIVFRMFVLMVIYLGGFTAGYAVGDKDAYKKGFVDGQKISINKTK